MSAPHPGWLTNNAAIAARLRAADEAYDLARSRIASRPMMLTDKVNAFRQARAAHDLAYAQVRAELTGTRS